MCNVYNSVFIPLDGLTIFVSSQVYLCCLSIETFDVVIFTEISITASG